MGSENKPSYTGRLSPRRAKADSVKVAATVEHQKELIEALTNAMPKSMAKPENLLDGIHKIWSDVTFLDSYGNLVINDTKFRKEVAWLTARKSKHKAVVPFEDVYEALVSSTSQQRDQPA